MNDTPTYEQGDTVWFDRGSDSWEHGTVWAIGHEEVAIAIGENPATGDPIERTLLPKSIVRPRKPSGAGE